MKLAVLPLAYLRAVSQITEHFLKQFHLPYLLDMGNKCSIKILQIMLMFVLFAFVNDEEGSLFCFSNNAKHSCFESKVTFFT
jgi:hypothetical protein